jgi:GntR family transcriptional regulator, transcriptional repressor for pyruvate dehydrogenase complex
MADKNTSGSIGSIVQHAIEDLRRTVFGRADGEFLGSEPDLVARLGISRPTFRQAAKLVEQEQLLTIKRGVGGGFFARRPSTTAVAHVAAVYLRTRNATIENAIQAAKPILAAIACAAAERADPETYAQLASFLAQERKCAADLRTFLRAEGDFLAIFAAASGNPVLELYARVLLDFAATFVASNMLTRSPERVPAYRAIRTRLIHAILEGDPDVAAVLSQRRSDLLIGWMESDMAAANSSAEPTAHQLIQPPAQTNGSGVQGDESEAASR